jgi:acetyl-CoA synthetase
VNNEQQLGDGHGPAIENLMTEDRRFRPPESFVRSANATRALYEEAEADPLAFWERRAREKLSWDRPFETVLEWEPPFAEWFLGGQLNVSYNCVDRHVENGLGDKVAYHWIGEPGDRRTLTFADLQREVSKAANALKELGVATGDRVAIYMPRLRASGRGAHRGVRWLLG